MLLVTIAARRDILLDLMLLQLLLTFSIADHTLIEQSHVNVIVSTFIFAMLLVVIMMIMMITLIWIFPGMSSIWEMIVIISIMINFFFIWLLDTLTMIAVIRVLELLKITLPIRAIIVAIIMLHVLMLRYDQLIRLLSHELFGELTSALWIMRITAMASTAMLIMAIMIRGMPMRGDILMARVVVVVASAAANWITWFPIEFWHEFS